MAPPDKPPPLPLAPDRAAVSNRISMLLAAQSSVLKSMNQSSSTSSSKRPRQHHHAPDEEDLFRQNDRPNEGVGYVADAAKTKLDDAAKEDRMLRGRLLGKRRDNNPGRRGARPADDDEEDDEGGRSTLGKRKRPKRAAETTVETVVADANPQTSKQDLEDNLVEEEAHKEGDEKDSNQTPEPAGLDPPHRDHTNTETQTKKKKKRKRKNKKEHE